MSFSLINNKLFAVFIIIFALLLGREYTFAQENTTSGSISGTVLDKDNNQPLAGATIRLFHQNDTVVYKGAETNSKGAFSINVLNGKYNVEISEVGYSLAIVKGITISNDKQAAVLDTIKLKQGTTITDEIEVEADKNVIELTPEKKIFNVEKSIVSSNGSATDVLRNVPSVGVDNDGNVSLKGSQNVRVMIDGRPVLSSVTSVLDGIPASSVQSIELITNPSAKYEAEGESGIINIVLKKNSDFGYNGSVILSTGTKDKYNASANLSLKKDKINVYGNYSFQSMRFGISGTSLRQNDINNVTSTLDQPSNGQFKNTSNLGKIGLDYSINDKQTIGIVSTYSYRKRNRDAIAVNSFYDNTGSLSAKTQTNSYNSETGSNFDAALDYKAKFKEPDRFLTFEASFSRSNEETPINVDNQYQIVNYNPAAIQNQQTYTDQTELRKTLNIQGDYVHPLGKDSKFETGIKSTYRLADNTFISQHFDTTANTWFSDDNLSNNFKYREFINAVYVTYSKKIKDFSFQVGLRAEQTNTKGEVSNTGEIFTKQYLNIFPSASISQKVGKSNEFQASYSRRLNRPRLGMLNPFGENTDPYNLRDGNPELNPEYIDSYELNYLKYISSSVITSAVYFRETHGLISRIKTPLDSVTTLTNFVNLSKAYSYGFELIASLQNPKWLNLTASFSYFNTKIIGDNVQSELSNSGAAWYTKFLATANLWYGFDLQMSYNYQSRRPVIDGYIEPFQTFDISLKREIVSKKFEMSLRVSDLFNTMKMEQSQSGVGYTQNSSFRRDSRVAFLTLTYRFGNLADNQKHKKPKEDNGPDMEN